MGKFEKVLQYIKNKPIILIIILIIMGVIIQSLVQLFYWIGREYPIFITEFSATDSLSYWGSFFASLIGALIAIIGVYITIQSSQKQTQSIIKNGNETTKELIINSRKDVNESNRKSVLPIIVINRIQKKYHGNLFASLVSEALLLENENNKEGNKIPIDKITYEEKNIDSIIFYISESKLNLQHDLTDEQKNRISSHLTIKRNKNGASIGPANYSYLPFSFCNGGLGPAINTCFTLIKDGYKGTNEFHITSIALSLKTNDDMKLSFFVDKPELCIGKYILEIEYYDIFTNRYIQNHELIINKDGGTFSLEINQILYLKE